MIDQLKKLVLEGGYDEESRSQVRSLESRLHKAMMAEQLAENPIIKEYVDYLTLEIDRCRYLLGNDDKLTDTQRNKLFAKVEIVEKFQSLFVSEKTKVEEEIKDLLHVASNS